MDEKEKKAIYYCKNVLHLAVGSTKVIKSLHKDGIINDEEKMNLLHTSTDKKMGNIIETVKHKPRGFTGLCKALLEEKISNKFIVDKMEAKVKSLRTGQTKQVVKLEEKDVKQSPQIGTFYEELHKIAHGYTRKTKVDPSEDELDNLVDDFCTCRDELTGNHQDDRSMLCLIKEKNGQIKHLQSINHRYKTKTSSLKDRLSSAERRANMAEQNYKELQMSMAVHIKTKAEQEVKRRLMSLKIGVPEKSSHEDCVANESDTADTDDQWDESEEEASNGNVNISLNVIIPQKT